MADDGMETVTKRVATFKTKTGRELTFCSLTLRDFVAARSEALRQYKRAKIETWTSNLDLMPKEERDRWTREAFERAEQISAEEMPEKEIDLPVYLSNGKIKRDSQNKPVFRRSAVEYAVWWMSETASGRLYMTWLSLRKAPGQEGMTLDEADQLFSDGLQDLESAAQLVGELSESKLAGNSKAPPETTTGGNEGKKRRRRKR